MNNRAVTVGVVLATSVALAARRTSGGSPSAAHTGSVPAIYARDLTPQLMTVDDLAAGWAVNPAPIMKVATPPCVGTFKVTHHSTDKV